MMAEHMYPITMWECGVCGKTNPGDIGQCVSCRSGTIFPGGLLHGEKPYKPKWHARQAGVSL